MLRGVTLLLAVICAGPVLAQCSADHVGLRGDWGETRFTIELVDTPESRSQGLMFRESMPRGAGMLFVYDAPQRAVFWMKNTLIPLDMLFVDQAGLITRIHSNAIPGDLTAIEGGAGVYAVLEINGGLAETYGLTVGSQMQHEVFSKGPPLWPC